MKIFVLHDPRRPESEWEACFKELERQGIEEFGRLVPVYAESVEKSINLTHKQAVRLAKHKGLTEVCIMESDVIFPAADGWRYFLANKPVVFDLYLAGVYSSSMESFRSLRPVLADSIIPIVQVNGMHCYIIHSNYYDTFLGTRDDEHIDAAQVKGNYKVCYPFAAIQRPGWSANNKKEVDYNLNLKPEDVHGW
jgi:hypothetical protein